MLNRGVDVISNLICSFVLVLIVFKGIRGQECGTVAPGGKKVPWQVGIFQLYSKEYKWRSGGTLISNKVILTSAFEVEDVDRPPEERRSRLLATLKVMAGNLSRYGTSPMDETLQMSDVFDVHLSPGFRERLGTSGDRYNPYKLNVDSSDIAVVVVKDPFRFNDFIRPACLNFDNEFELQQLKWPNKGKVAAWAIGKTEEYSYLREYDCITAAQRTNRSWSVSWLKDKICAQLENEQNPENCHKDKGMGIAFPATENGVERYYLRGVFTGTLEAICSNNNVYGFVLVRTRENFIRKYWNETKNDIPKLIGKCQLPPTPEHGSFAINVTHTNISAGEDFMVVSLTLTCQEGYGVVGDGTINCYNGFWPDIGISPTCVRMCQLEPHPSVEYRCLVAGEDVSTRECGYYEPVGVTVSPRCHHPHYYSASTLPFMKCKENGHWDYMAKCMPECGRVTPDGKMLVVGGVKAKKGEIPWHAGIYKKTTPTYMQICGGSIINNYIIISAAHCFYTDLEKQLPADQFAVAVGKIYRPWDDPADEGQKLDVKRIHLPKRYQGSGASFQDDIAVVVVSEPIQYKTFVRPVCLNFDSNFDRLQLQTINKGKVAGWGLTAADGKPSPVLRAVDLPYVEVGTCLTNSPPDFREYITSDKICAGTQDSGSALCKGDSGGGLAFPTADHGTERYYLRGVVSTAPNDDHACNAHTYTSFTQIIKHEDFMKPFLTES